ncbi:MAG TPA: hypothetical protein VFZ41_05525 [Solirubrobacterales bacterium]
MRKLIVALTAAVVLALAPAASGHPSENRAEKAFFGGPHCHINLQSGHFAFPSHRAHIVTGTPEGVFVATGCP